MADLAQERDKVIAEHGPWSAHNIHLGGGVYTMSDTLLYDAGKTLRINQIIDDVRHKEIRDLRILDLACLEGMYGIEMALHGADVVGIEGRAANLAKSEFTKRALKLDNIEFIQDDVRNLGKAKYGEFDIVLCIGILYHINVPDVFEFIEKMSEVCSHALIVDTHISVEDNEEHVYKGATYRGRSFNEYSGKKSEDDKEQSLWASIGNDVSFWPNRPSLYNLLSRSGFTSVFECHNPPDAGRNIDRVTLVAVKGKCIPTLIHPAINSLPKSYWTNDPAANFAPPVHKSGVPGSIKDRITRKISKITNRPQ